MKKYFSLTAGAVILVVIFGTMYALVQQDLRQSANDPQVQLAYDAASRLASGATPDSLVPEKSDVTSSLAPFLVIYDKTGKAVAGSGTLDGVFPVMPLGVLQAADREGYHAVTWQPKSNVRLASATVAGKDYYVVSARSLYLVEKREEQTGILATIGLAASLILFIFFVALPLRLKAT